MQTLKPALCVIGAGTAGIAVATRAAREGAQVVLVERHKLGGESLHYGCIPSKALLATAHANEALANTALFGIRVGGPTLISYDSIHGHLSDTIKSCSTEKSMEHLQGAGITVLMGRAQFANPRTIEVGDIQIQAKHFVLATGSRPSVPPVDGLKDIPYLTNESIFNLAERPQHLVIIGGGGVGTELCQAFCLLGSRVTLVTQGRLLSQEDPGLTGVIKQQLENQGVRVVEHAKVQRFGGEGDKLTMEMLVNGSPEVITMSHVLVAVGRSPRFASLQPEVAGVICQARGIKVDEYLRTSNRRVFALGDCIGQPYYSHTCRYEADVVVDNALHGKRRTVDYSRVPRVLFTRPGLAAVGLSERDARKKYRDIRVWSAGFPDNDRARTLRVPLGIIQVIARADGTVLGVSIAGPDAGELLLPWQLAIASGIKLGAIADTMAPYPTLSEISVAVARQYTAQNQQPGLLTRLLNGRNKAA